MIEKATSSATGGRDQRNDSLFNLLFLTSRFIVGLRLSSAAFRKDTMGFTEF